MADQYRKPSIAALRRLEASVEQDLREQDECARVRLSVPSWLMIGVPPWRLLMGVPFWQVTLPQCWFRLRKFTYVVGTLAAIILTLMGGLWWRLGNGPIELDIATPWLTAAIEENFGAGHRVEVGGTQLERDANGRTALRIRDIVVRDPDGTIVASAPKAEVGVSGSGLMSGRVRAERLSLVGAEMAVRIESDSKVTVFAGANKRPFVTASAASTPVQRAIPLAAARPERLATGAVPAGRAAPDFAALLAWIDTLGATGLDGRELGELGLKNGNLTVDDQRNGKQWSFHDINLSLTRPSQGSLALTLSSGAVDAPWKLRAEMIPSGNSHRIIDIEAEKVPARDLMLAMRLGDGQLEPDFPLSAHIRAELAPDGTPRILGGSILLEKGFLIDPDDPLAKIAIDRAEFSLEWDAMRRALAVPFQIVSGGNRLTLMAQVDAPTEMGAPWGLKIAGGTVVLASAGDLKPAHSQSPDAADAGRPGEAADRPPAGRIRQYGSRRRHLRQPRLLGRRSAPRDRYRRQSHVDECAEASLAGFHLAQGAHVGRRSHRQRDGRASGDRDQCADIDAQVEAGRRSLTMASRSRLPGRGLRSGRCSACLRSATRI